MANNKKSKQPKNPLIGNQAKPTILDNTTKLDIDTKGTLIDNIIYTGLNGRLDTADLENFTRVSNSRDQVYQLIDTMSQDSAVASIIRTYSEDVCETADNGHIIWCESPDPKISKFVNYLLNVINVDKNIFGWTYCLLKYGDVYLRLYRESDYKDCLFRQDKVNNAFSARNVLNEDLVREQVNLNIHAANDPYSYYVEMVADPSTMFELDKYGKIYGYVEVPNMKSNFNAFGSTMMGADSNTNVYNFRLKSSDVNIYQADDFVHACLEDNFTRFPETVDIFLNTDDFTNNSNSQSYSVRRGRSLLYDSYKVWREKALLENAAMLNRITRSSIFRKVQVEVGDMPKEKVSQILRQTKEMMEQKTAVNTNGSMSEYANPGPMENFIYFATHNGQGGVSVESIGGDVDVKNLADLDWWNNKFYSSYGIPKQYFGWCFSKDTEILLLNGEKLTIEELYNNKDKYIGKGIMACNSDGSLCPTKIANVMQTSTNADLIRVHLDNGKYVDVTPDHRLMLRDGTFKRADELKENDSLMPYYDKIKDGRHLVLDNKLDKFVDQSLTVVENCILEVARKVTKIEYLSSGNTVYDITVDADCHTFALPCGIFVHNCDDSTGFNGGTSLTILSSVYAKGVKRVQNAMIQAITDLINLILINKGCASYLNNFVLKMKAPLTQEEIDYRADLTNRASAISNLQSIFTDIEDKSRRLKILKELLLSLNYGDGIINEINEEIKAADEAKVKEAEEAAKAAEEEAKKLEAEAASEKATDVEPPALDDLGGGDLDLAPMPDENLPKESFKPVAGTSTLTEDPDFLTEGEDDLPTPEEADKNRDFSENE